MNNGFRCGLPGVSATETAMEYAMRFESPMTKFSNVSVEVTELFGARWSDAALSAGMACGAGSCGAAATGAAAACWSGVLAEAATEVCAGGTCWTALT